MSTLVQQSRPPVTPIGKPLQATTATDDLRVPLTPQRFGEIRATLLESKFVIFRDQDLSHEQLIELAQQFGELDIHPLDRLEAYPAIQPLRSGANPKRAHDRSWTSNSSWREKPPFAVFERSIEVPARGGDTAYADMGAVYRGLSDEMKATIDGLYAVHSAAYAFDAKTGFRDPETAARIAHDFPPVAHPIVRSHPQTGEQLLYVNQAHTSHVVGLSKPESDRLLQLLFDQITIPEYQIRIKWLRPHSVAFYDAAALQFFAIEDFDPALNRYAERVEISGTKPYR